MARRRELVHVNGNGPVEPPEHFVYADWAAPGEHPVEFGDDIWMRAMRRWLDAHRAWREEGIS